MDTATALPRAVKKQGDAARALQQGVVDAATAASGESVQQDAQQKPAGTQSNPAPQGDAATLAAENDRLKSEALEHKTNLDKVQHRLDVMLNKYNSEVPPLHKKIKELQDQIDKKPASDGAQVEKIKVEDLFTQEQIDTYGAPMLETMVAGVSKMLGKQKPAAQERAQPSAEDQESEDAKRRTAERTSRFFVKLKEAVPLFEELNEDVGFLAWLEKFDATAKTSRMNLIRMRQDDLDAAGVAEIFKAYQEGREIDNAKPNNEPHIQPNSGLGGGPPKDDAVKGKVWKRSEITAFFKDKKLGKYRGRDADAAKIEADIFLADREGRIVAG